MLQRRGVLTLTQPTGWEGAREPKENRADQGQDTRRTPQGARPMAIPCLGFPVSHRCCDWPDPVGWVRRRSSWPLSDKGATAGSLVGTSPSPPQLGWAPTPDSTKREEDALAEAGEAHFHSGNTNRSNREQVRVVSNMHQATRSRAVADGRLPSQDRHPSECASASPGPDA